LTEDRQQERRLECARVVTPDGVLEGAVLTVRDGLIRDIRSSGPGQPPPDEVIEGWVVPGFVDTHCHGGGGADYATTDPEQARRARRFHRSHGTTTSLASLVTTDIDLLCAQLETLVPLVEEGELAGVHLEGPFLSPVKAGAHDPARLRVPQPETLDRLLTVGGSALAMITIAPELPGALAAIRRLSRAGVTVAIGHTDADERQVGEALNAGATVATHLFNAMRPVHHRNPGPVPKLLTDARCQVELICDGVHVHPDAIRLVLAAAGTGRTALITDAMVATGMPDGNYSLGDRRVRVVDGRARLVDEDGELGSIAGSTITMANAFAFVVGLGVPIPDAAQLAASTPARWHRLSSVGAIEVSRRADLCVVDEKGVLLRTLEGGVEVARQSPAPGSALPTQWGGSASGTGAELPH
jgi:N-acetylglucosamine-6-phosphate deacetylase